MSWAPLCRPGMGLKLLLPISVPAGYTLRKLRLVYSTATLAYNFSSFLLVMLVDSYPTELWLFMPYSDLKRAVTLAISSRGW